MLVRKPVLMRTVPTRFMTVAALCATGTLTLAACASGSTSAAPTPEPPTAVATTAATDAATINPGSSSGVLRDAGETQSGVAYASTSPSQTLDLYLPASSGCGPGFSKRA